MIAGKHLGKLCSFGVSFHHSREASGFDLNDILENTLVSLYGFMSRFQQNVRRDFAHCSCFRLI